MLIGKEKVHQKFQPSFLNRIQEIHVSPIILFLLDRRKNMHNKIYIIYDVVNFIIWSYLTRHYSIFDKVLYMGGQIFIIKLAFLYFISLLINLSWVNVKSHRCIRVCRIGNQCIEHIQGAAIKFSRTLGLILGETIIVALSYSPWLLYGHSWATVMVAWSNPCSFLLWPLERKKNVCRL